MDDLKKELEIVSIHLFLLIFFFTNLITFYFNLKEYFNINILLTGNNLKIIS
jgi:hypothetical protein